MLRSELLIQRLRANRLQDVVIYPGSKLGLSPAPLLAMLPHSWPWQWEWVSDIIVPNGDVGSWFIGIPLTSLHYWFPNLSDYLWASVIWLARSTYAKLPADGIRRIQRVPRRIYDFALGRPNLRYSIELIYRTTCGFLIVCLVLGIQKLLNWLCWAWVIVLATVFTLQLEETILAYALTYVLDSVAKLGFVRSIGNFIWLVLVLIWQTFTNRVNFLKAVEVVFHFLKYFFWASEFPALEAFFASSYTAPLFFFLRDLAQFLVAILLIPFRGIFGLLIMVKIAQIVTRFVALPSFAQKLLEERARAPMDLLLLVVLLVTFVSITLVQLIRIKSL